MRDLFRGWYRPTEDELELLWSKGTIALDANVLLAPYRIANDRRKQLFNVLEAFRDQLWCAHQAALEYQRNRLTVAAEQLAEYARIVAVLDKAETDITQRRRDHPVLDAKDLELQVQRSFAAVKRYVRAVQAEHPNLLGDDLLTDVIRANWDELLDGRVSSPLAVDEEWRKSADLRYAKKIPPGFKDARKTDGREYGDLIIWTELLDVTKERSAASGNPVPVLFVTDDGKSDWWREHDGRKLGPHLELVAEMEAAGGSPFWMYTVSGFVLEGERRQDWGQAGPPAAALLDPGAGTLPAEEADESPDHSKHQGGPTSPESGELAP